MNRLHQVPKLQTFNIIKKMVFSFAIILFVIYIK